MLPLRPPQLDSEMPSGVLGLSKVQRDWWEKLDRDYVPHYYRLRLKESAEDRREKSRADTRETGRDRRGLSALPGPGPRQPASATGPLRQRRRRVSAGGARRGRGGQAPTRRHPDRPATSPLVPHREPVVLAAGRTLRGRGGLHGVVEVLPVDFLGPCLRQPQSVHGSSPGRRGLRHALAQPRKASADEPLLAQAPATDSCLEPAEKPPISMRTIWIYFGVVGVIGLFAFIRAMSRRVRGDGGPAGLTLISARGRGLLTLPSVARLPTFIACPQHSIERPGGTSLATAW